MVVFIVSEVLTYQFYGCYKFYLFKILLIFNFIAISKMSNWFIVLTLDRQDKRSPPSSGGSPRRGRGGSQSNGPRSTPPKRDADATNDKPAARGSGGNETLNGLDHNEGKAASALPQRAARATRGNAGARTGSGTNGGEPSTAAESPVTVS